MENPYQAPQSTPDFVPLAPVTGARPTSITVFGVLNVVFGSIGIACTPFSLMTIFMPQPAGAPANPMLDLMRSENYRAFLIGSCAVSWVASGFLLAAGIGLLKERSWGRKLAVGYGIYSIFATIFSTALNFVFLVMPLMEASKQQGESETTTAIVLVTSTVFGALLGLIFPVLLLIFMTRPRVVAFLESSRPDAFNSFRMTPV